jgi:DNA-binding PadR family transcriptional regulator
VPLSRADRDLPGLTVLALLLTGPRHTYEMHRMIVDTHKDFVTGLPRSLYHAVERLLRAELIEVHDVRRDGPHPERTLYSLTGAGRDVLADRVERLLTTPDGDATTFVAALSFAGVLPGARAVAALRRRAAELEGRLTTLAAGLASVPAGLPRFLLLEGEFEHVRMRAEADFAATTATAIEDGSLPWPDDPDGLLEAVPMMPGAETHLE